MTGSGRTDAGVHAYGQVAHFDTDRDIDTDEVQGAINYHVKAHPIAIVGVEKLTKLSMPGFPQRKALHLQNMQPARTADVRQGPEVARENTAG